MFRLLPLVALAGLLFFCNACERHHPGEMPEVQKEHLHPLDPGAEEGKILEPTSPSASPTPANFFPKQQP